MVLDQRTASRSISMCLVEPKKEITVSEIIIKYSLKLLNSKSGRHKVPVLFYIHGGGDSARYLK